MKKSLVSVLFTVALTFSISTVSAQCTPDANCIDTELPGEICPDTLAQGVLSEYYSEVITIIPPYEADLGDSVIIPIAKIVLTGIENIPPGLSFASNEPSQEFVVGNTYCILVSGTPTDTGTFYLKIITDIYIGTIQFPILAQEYIDSTSVFIKINEQDMSISDNRYSNFYIYENEPNPFSYETTIGFYSAKSENSKLQIFNQFGQLIYSENKKFPTGENYFDFNGQNLRNGIYFYSISNEKNHIVNKMMKIGL